MIRWRFFIVGLFFAAVIPCYAQEFEFSDPVSPGPGINSDSEESCPLISTDGKSLYFSRAFDPRNEGGEITGMDIWLSQRDSRGKWSPAVKANDTWNNKGTNAVIGIRNNNSIVYLLNAYRNKPGIAFSQLKANAWSDPEVIPIRDLNSSNFVGYYVDPSFQVLLISMNRKDSFGEEDLYVCTRDSVGTWSRPVNLGPTINTKGFEISPFLSADGRRLYFASDGHPGMGDADIYYSERLYGSWQTWTQPRSIGDNINSSSFDAFFSIYGDSVAYFTSNRGGGLADIYQVKVKLNDNIFDKEKKYLTQEEVNQLIGAKVDLNVVFNKNSADLTAAQSELLFFITNKIITQSDIKVQLNIRQGETSDLTAERIKTVSDKFKSLGLSASRMDRAIGRALKERSGDENIVKVLFFR